MTKSGVLLQNQPRPQKRPGSNDPVVRIVRQIVGSCASFCILVRSQFPHFREPRFSADSDECSADAAREPRMSDSVSNYTVIEPV